MKTFEELKKIAEFNSKNCISSNTVIYETEEENHQTFLLLPTQNSYRINVPPPLVKELHGSITLFGHNFYFIDIDKI